MSNDQKPARIKIINTGAPARAPVDGSKRQVAAPVTVAEPTTRAMKTGPIVFLLGCAIGGAALAAWPHIITG